MAGPARRAYEYTRSDGELPLALPPCHGKQAECLNTIRRDQKMTSPSSLRKHAGPGPDSGQPAIPEPSFAERARTLLHMARVGSLSTLSRKQPGFPFGSLMPYGLDEHGRPI